jgi:hypothetical protein
MKWKAGAASVPAVVRPVTGNRRVGSYYAAGAVCLAGLACVASPLSCLLLWPATSLGLVGAAYFGLGPGIFRKSHGQLPLSSWLLLWPVLLGHRISLIHYARSCRPWDVLTDRVWIGRTLSDAEAWRAIAGGVTAVLDLASEFSEARPFLDLAYLHVPVMDLTAPTLLQLEHAVGFVCRQSAHGTVYVHCKIGYSRTAAVAGAYLLASGRAVTVEQALAMLRDARSSIVVRPEAVRALHRYFAHIVRSHCRPGLRNEE